MRILEGITPVVFAGALSALVCAINPEASFFELFVCSMLAIISGALWSML